MFTAQDLPTGDKPSLYAELAAQARALLEGETDRIANAANFAALAYQALPAINWAGFYFYDGTELVLGPFQGKPACVRIALDRGVCGAAASQRLTQVVADVHAFPGHIACDAASRSEIVVPLVHDGRLLGVWDVDSPEPGRFDEEDRQGMEALCAVFLDSLAQAGAAHKTGWMTATREPLIDESGEVRELTEEDFKHFRPAHEVLPVSLQEKLGMRVRAGNLGDAPTNVNKAGPQK